MDIGNLPIYNNDNKQKSRTFGQVPEPKSAWDQIGDYDQGPATTTTTNDDDEDDKRPEQFDNPIKTPTAKERQESDQAASDASKAAVKESRKNQL